MAAGPPKPSGAVGGPNSLHQAEAQGAAEILGLRGWRLRGRWDSERTLGSKGHHRTDAERLIQAQSQQGRGQLLGKSGQQQELKGIVVKEDEV